jgi:hypothetical protein
LKAVTPVGSFRGTIGLEGWASTDSTEALERFRNAFTLNGDG